MFEHRFNRIIEDLYLIRDIYLDYLHAPEPLDLAELENLMSATDDLNAIVATLQTTATEVVAAFAAASDQTATESAVAALQGVNTTLQGLVTPAAPTEPAAPAA